MVDTRVWGVVGILLTLVGAVIIAPELLHSIAEGHTYIAAYGVAAVAAAVVTLLIVGRGLFSEA
jgi:hypothetical protein